MAQRQQRLEAEDNLAAVAHEAHLAAGALLGSVAQADNLAASELDGVVTFDEVDLCGRGMCRKMRATQAADGVRDAAGGGVLH